MASSIDLTKNDVGKSHCYISLVDEGAGIAV